MAKLETTSAPTIAKPLLAICILSLAVRSMFGMPILHGTWLRSALSLSPESVVINSMPILLDSVQPWLRFVFLILCFASAVVVMVLGRAGSLRILSWGLLGLVLISAMGSFAFPISLLVSPAVNALTVVGFAVIIGAVRLLSSRFRREPLDLRWPLEELAVFGVALSVIDWMNLLFIGGS